MEEAYNFKEVEPKVNSLWERGNCFAPADNSSRKPYSMFLVPPNASGPLHVGNALMIAIQDVLARYHRAKGEPTVWIPGTDHGGYETQVTFEQQMGKVDAPGVRSRKTIFDAIDSFVKRNNETIIRQIEAVGASVDWSRFRFTLDKPSLAFVDRMFKKMLSDNLIYRDPYMVYYCPSCATVLADIELKQVEVPSPLYSVKFQFKNGEGYLALATTRPEFLFAVTHVLAHPHDKRLSHFIGQQLINPVTGEVVDIVESKRKFDPKEEITVLPVFSPSHIKYDFEYAIRHKIPSRNLLDWDGKMIERYPGLKPDEARRNEVEYLTSVNAIEKVDESYSDTSFLCKKGHTVQSVIRMSWFLRLDDEKKPLRQQALNAMTKENLAVYPRWREKGLVEWIGKMHDWPIARQNVWGITISIWYEITDPALFTVWFMDAQGSKKNGNLQELLDAGHSFKEIEGGLERIYAAEGCVWTVEREAGKTYLPETDTFDTWFSSGAWSAMVFDPVSSPGTSHFYPTSVVVIGYDLLRLSIAREIILGTYLTGKLPFKRVYFHSLLKSKDGQKMSKSLGNAVTLDQYLEKFGADVTRMALVSYTAKFEDFFFSDERLELFKAFAARLWTMGRISDAANIHSVGRYKPELLSAEDQALLSDVSALGRSVGLDLEKYFLAQAQEKLVSFLQRFEDYAAAIQARDDAEQAIAVLHSAFKDYITILHPFMPFMTEELYTNVYKSSRPLAATLAKPTSQR